MKNCFKDDYHGEWAGFYNLGLPALAQSRHMMWHKQYRQTEKPHEDHWYHDTEEKLMQEYIRRHYDGSVLDVLEGLRRDAVYVCSDPRMHIRERAQVTKSTNDAAERLKEDFETLHQIIDDYVTEHGCIPYCVVHQDYLRRLH